MIQFFCDESAEAGMRGAFVDQGGLFSYIAPEARVPANHPLRKIRELVRDVLGELNRCPYRKSNPEVLMVQSSEERLRNDAADGLDRPRNRRILVQR
jgi:hypothetical protein